MQNTPVNIGFALNVFTEPYLDDKSHPYANMYSQWFLQYRKNLVFLNSAFLHTLDQQPDDHSYDVKQMIDTGLSNVDSGSLISNEEMKDIISF